MSSCCPDLLDPSGWRAGDQLTVLAHVEAAYGLRSEEGRFLCLRFAGGDDGIGLTTREAAKRACWPLRRARSVVAGALNSMPPVAEPDDSLDVVFEDRDMVVVVKPAGVPVTPRHRFRVGSVTNRLAAHVGPCVAAELRPVHRLDLGTSGVLCFAKSGSAATHLMRQFEERKVSKLYAALCVGEAPGWSDTQIDAPIGMVTASQEAGQAVRSVCQPGVPGALEASTKLCVALGPASGTQSIQAAAMGKAFQGISLILAAPLQGRTHQVRLHCATAGIPILADELYGVAVLPGVDCTSTGGDLFSRPALHALAVRLRHPRTGAQLLLHAPLPADMDAIRRKFWPDVAQLQDWADASATGVPDRAGNLGGQYDEGRLDWLAGSRSWLKRQGWDL